MFPPRPSLPGAMTIKPISSRLPQRMGASPLEQTLRIQRGSGRLAGFRIGLEPVERRVPRSTGK